MMVNLQIVSAVFTLLLLNFLARSVHCSATPPPDVSTLLAQCKNIESKFPSPNSYTCYRTTTKKGGRFQTCEAAHIREGAVSVVNSNENYTIMVVHTPGRLQNRTYIDRLLCRWDIRCPNNQLMYYDMAEHFIEPQRTSPLFQQEVCVDYLKLYRDNGIERSCGFVDNYTDLEPNNLRIEFRSNKNFRFPGFKLRIVCFNPDLQDILGCSNSQIDNPPSDVQQRRRQARNAGSVTGSMKQRLEPFSHLRPLRSNRIRRRTGVQQMAVDRDSSIRYASTTLQIIKPGSVTFSVEGILSFHTYNSLDGLVSYYSDRIQEVELRGAGLLTISRDSGVAYYYRYGVDSKFMPSQRQRDAISKMLGAEEVLVVKDDFVIQEEEAVTTPTMDISSSIDEPTTTTIQQQSVAASQGLFAPDVIDTALRGANSCNAVVRAVSESVLDLAEFN